MTSLPIPTLRHPVEIVRPPRVVRQPTPEYPILTSSEKEYGKGIADDQPKDVPCISIHVKPGM